MTDDKRAEHRRVLLEMGGIDKHGEYSLDHIHWFCHPCDNGNIELGGVFSPNQLEAIAAWMRDPSLLKEPEPKPEATRLYNYEEGKAI